MSYNKRYRKFGLVRIILLTFLLNLSNRLSDDVAELIKWIFYFFICHINHLLFGLIYQMNRIPLFLFLNFAQVIFHQINYIDCGSIILLHFSIHKKLLHYFLSWLRWICYMKKYFSYLYLLHFEVHLSDALWLLWLLSYLICYDGHFVLLMHHWYFWRTWS